MKKTIIIFIIAVVIAGGAFYAGMKYSQSRFQANFQNFRPGQFNASAGAGLRGGNSGNAGFVSGEIISKDDKSLTVKLRDGGSKIIFYSASSEISKFASGDSNDLQAGETVSVQGTANQDGSITASSIQIRPAMQNPQSLPNQ